MYFDDFVADNNLGTHFKAHSMAGVYFILPFLPVQIQFFLMYLFKSKDKKLANKVIFAPLIKQMMQLEEQGIDVLIGGKLINVKFVLGLILAGADWPYNEVGKITRGPSRLGAPKAIGGPSAS
jgi:hypothetical protein